MYFLFVLFPILQQNQAQHKGLLSLAKACMTRILSLSLTGKVTIVVDWIVVYHGVPVNILL